MSGNASGHRQRAVMASDAEWEMVGQVAKRGGMDRSRYLIHRALMPDALSTEVLRRAVRELLVLSLVEERRQREAGAGQAWEDTCERTFGAKQLRQGRYFSCIRQPRNGFCNPPFPGCNRNREKMNGQNHPHRCPRQSAPAPQGRIRHTRQQAHRVRRLEKHQSQLALIFLR